MVQTLVHHVDQPDKFPISRSSIYRSLLIVCLERHVVPTPSPKPDNQVPISLLFESTVRPVDPNEDNSACATCLRIWVARHSISHSPHDSFALLQLRTLTTNYTLLVPRALAVLLLLMILVGLPFVLVQTILGFRPLISVPLY